MPIDLFPILIGRIIHGCGVLELLTDDMINDLGRDSILSKEIVSLDFGRRINILRELLYERTSLQAEDVDSLCNDLSRIAEDRNIIAHNRSPATIYRAPIPAFSSFDTDFILPTVGCSLKQTSKLCLNGHARLSRNFNACQ